MRKIFSNLTAWVIAKRHIICGVLAITALDRITKVFTLELLVPVQSVCLLKYFCLTYVENTGMAFGLFQNANLALGVLMVLVIIFIIYSWRDIAALSPKLGNMSLTFILGGAIGNLYDRITLGFVVDFIDLRVWPVFNIADAFICTGAVVLALIILFNIKKEAPITEEK